MSGHERQVLAQQVVHFYINFAKFDKLVTVLHFEKMGYQRRRLYKIIKRYEERGTTELRTSSGREYSVTNPKKITAIKRLLINKNRSIRDAAKIVGISKSRVGELKLELGIKSNKCQKTPKYVKNQKKRAKTNCRKIYRKSIRKVLVLDDETYVKSDPKANYGNRYYHCKDKQKVPDSVRFTGVEKFGEKFMVWQAIDEFGNISEPYIKKGTMTSEEYRTECIEKILIPFIKKHHRISDVLFWPDMAPIHYSNSVRQCLESNGVQYVDKKGNAPAVPQARPIEPFWNVCKIEYSKKSKTPKNVKEFEKVWSQITDNVRESVAQTLTEGLRRTLKLIGDKGVMAPFKVKD